MLLLIAAFSRHVTALEWARQKGEQQWGPIALESDVFAFDHTEYYEGTMGDGLKKRFFAYQQPLDPAELATVKHITNAWEATFQQQSGLADMRPLNLDPGYISEGKLVLASTKDHAHRIYLRDGIYAEVTLYFRNRQWRAREWTFADYRQSGYHAFFDRCRRYLRENILRS